MKEVVIGLFVILLVGAGCTNWLDQSDKCQKARGVLVKTQTSPYYACLERGQH